MKDQILEESIIFVSIFKWILLASAIGIIIGIATAAFLRILQASISYATSYPYYFCLLPSGLFLSAILVQYVAREAKGYGTEKVIEAVHKQSGRMRAIVIPVKLVATVATATVGGSVGQIGPCAQIGGSLASVAAGVLRFDDNDRKKLVICGISAGFAAVLGAPIAGAIFGVEVLFVGAILYEVLLPSFIAGIISYHTASFFGTAYFYYPFQIAPAFSDTFFFINIIAGVFFGLCAIVVIETVQLTNLLSEKVNIWSPLKGIIGGITLVILTFLFSTRYLGLGLNTIQETLRGVQIASTAFLMKTIFTAITFASGGSGGIIAPILFIGATAGSFFGDLINMDRSTFAALGLVSVLAGAANAPISMSILAIELFGREIGAYAAVACVISFLITGHRSIFPTQIIAMKKSSSVDLELGQEMDNIKTQYKYRDKSLIGRWIRMTKKLRKAEKEK
jgi:H+/Cl- antiporter ClcA